MLHWTTPPHLQLPQLPISPGLVTGAGGRKMFQRKGTVSKSSGPVHVNSYALRGVPIRYTPPFYLPDQLTLPSSWTLPTFPSEDLFRYDYTKEKKVLEQARIRTISLAAEAQAREKREKTEEEKQRIEAAAAAERAKSQPRQPSFPLPSSPPLHNSTHSQRLHPLIKPMPQKPSNLKMVIPVPLFTSKTSGTS
ncbi:hypothetical protein GBAR_LOCUS28357 [Geodia barretti]|uniref:Uncharacterized protein n=1 Tax=Geodia barretti TaxID=519541 RepID=A0AA35XAS1_GEOBA|nr:hypothetical protein GBAR_LOCUS28357 [Geodia barretti]